MIYRFIGDHQGEYPVSRLCRTLGVSISGFYAWRKNPESQHAREDGKLKNIIEETFQANRSCYGSPRIHVELQAQGYHCSRKRVARLMQERGLCARIKRHRTHTTHQDPTHQKAENVLNQNFQAAAPNQKWVADVTVLETKEGPLFLAGVLDLCSRSLVGWSVAPIQDETLVHNALHMAVQRRHPEQGLLHHSDRGCQYTSVRYQQYLTSQGMSVSMSRTGNCYDNATMESFWSTLKWECVPRSPFQTRVLARSLIFEYIECFYVRSVQPKLAITSEGMAGRETIPDNS